MSVLLCQHGVDYISVRVIDVVVCSHACFAETMNLGNLISSPILTNE